MMALIGSAPPSPEWPFASSGLLSRTIILHWFSLLRNGFFKTDPSEDISFHRAGLRFVDDELSHAATLNLGKTAKRSYIPRRLVFGNDEYVQIGNGNQLVRDPKKRTSALSSEKVRWGLHTARLRLARKRKYCQFFTRFGKCNKNDRKCPHIHDPSKIAVCTKFLNGLRSNSDCKLTHKVYYFI